MLWNLFGTCTLGQVAYGACGEVNGGLAVGVMIGCAVLVLLFHFVKPITPGPRIGRKAELEYRPPAPTPAPGGPLAEPILNWSQLQDFQATVGMTAPWHLESAPARIPMPSRFSAPDRGT